MSLFQLVFAPLCVGISIWFLIRLVRRQLPRPQGLLWSFVWAVGAGLIAIPNAASIVAHFLGIGRGTDLLSYLAILAGLLAAVYFYNCFRRLEDTVTQLARQQALQGAERGAIPVCKGESEEWHLDPGNH